MKPSKRLLKECLKQAWGCEVFGCSEPAAALHFKSFTKLRTGKRDFTTAGRCNGHKEQGDIPLSELPKLVGSNQCPIRKPR